jgi:hypothetical protein
VSIYADTSVLFSLYVTDANSPRADAWRQANPVPLGFNGFHRIELRNELSLAVFQDPLMWGAATRHWRGEARRAAGTGAGE